MVTYHNFKREINKNPSKPIVEEIIRFLTTKRLEDIIVDAFLQNNKKLGLSIFAK